MSTPLPRFVKVRITEPFELAFMEKQTTWGTAEKASSKTR
jgi:hypothetical protein